MPNNLKHGSFKEPKHQNSATEIFPLHFCEILIQAESE